MIKGYKWRNSNERRDTLLKTLENKITAIFFDTETTGIANESTGLTEDEIKIIQFSGILYDISYEQNKICLKQKESLNIYINPEERLSPEVIALTGITNEMLGSADRENVAAWKIARFMKKSNLWIAYNTPYDIKRLQGMRKRTGIDLILPNEGDLSPETYDVLPMARDLIDPEAIQEYKKANKISKRGTYKLELLTPMLLPSFKASFHNSLDDVKSTAMLFEYLYPEYTNMNTHTGTKKLTVKKFSYDIASPYNMMKTRRIVIYTEPIEANSKAFAEKCGIYWDVTGSVWSCESDKDSKNLFKEVDLADLENQVLKLAKAQGYIKTNEYEILSMDTIHIESSKRWAATQNGKYKLAQVKRIAKERKLNVKNSELEKLFSDIQID